MNNLYDVLETCLQDIEAGADIESVLLQYPELADELRPILETSIQAREIAVPTPAPDVIRRNRAKLLQHAAQLREANVQTSRRFWSVPIRRALVSMAVIAALFMSGTGLVRAASTTLPGDNLYPVKRTWEDVLTTLTFNPDVRQALEIAHENERLEELYEIFADGRSASVDFAGLVTHQNGDLWLVSKIPVILSAQTDLRTQSIVVGDAVRVRGLTQTDGTVLAERVERLSAGMPLPEVDYDDSPEIEQEEPDDADNDQADNVGKGSDGEAAEVDKTETPKAESTSTPIKISLNGIVSSINGSIVIVNGQPMQTSTAEIWGTAHIGATVKVEGYFDASGVFIVTRIEFSGTGSADGSGSDSNGNSDDDDGANNDDNGSSDDNTNNDNSNDNGGDDN